MLYMKEPSPYLAEAKRLWTKIPEGPDKQRQREFVAFCSTHVLDRSCCTNWVYHFKEIRNLDTGKRFVSIGEGSPFDNPKDYITANEARRLVGLKPLPLYVNKVASREKPYKEAILKPSKAKPVVIKKPPQPIKKSIPIPVVQPKPFKLSGSNLLVKKVVAKELPPRPIKRKL